MEWKYTKFKCYIQWMTTYFRAPSKTSRGCKYKGKKGRAETSYREVARSLPASWKERRSEGKGPIFGTYLGRYAGEALRPGKVIDRHGVELDVALLLQGFVDPRLVAFHAVGQPALEIALGRQRPEARQGQLARRPGRSRGRSVPVQLIYAWKTRTPCHEIANSYENSYPYERPMRGAFPRVSRKLQEWF